MKSVGASEAKAHFSDLLDLAVRGEKITITRHGIPAALLVPFTEAAPRMPHKEIVEGMRALRKRVKHGKTNTSEMIKKGRRF